MPTEGTTRLEHADSTVLVNHAVISEVDRQLDSFNLCLKYVLGLRLITYFLAYISRSNPFLGRLHSTNERGLLRQCRKRGVRVHVAVLHSNPQRADLSAGRRVELDGTANVGGGRIFLGRQREGKMPVACEIQRVGPDLGAGIIANRHWNVHRSRRYR